jgi:hypothetical protein
MFVVCTVVLVGVSLATPAPAPRKVAGLTWQTVHEKIAMDEVEAPSVLAAPAQPESGTAQRLNLAFATLLVLMMISLWVYFA